ncbi:MAG: GHKL domain-containing protein [Lachnospiraceae bacterium]|nr:GHKL domain-containing protein [Lachnospiraceae bacterium]
MIESLFYLFLNAFRIYIMHRFINLFFDKSMQKKRMPYCYAAYYIINCTVYLFMNSNVLNLLVSIIGLLLVVIFSYEGSGKRKTLSVIANAGVSLLTENIAWAIFTKGNEKDLMEFGFFFSIFLMFLLEVLIEKTVSFHKGVEISFFKEFLLIVIIISSMFVADVMVVGVYHNKLVLIISLCILLSMNIAIFYTYEKFLNDYAKQKEEEMHRLQLVMYQNQLRIMQSANDVYVNLRHDMKHHMIMLSEYIDKNEQEKALKYLEKMVNYIGINRQYVDTGNECIDCIFNYMIDEISKSGGLVKTDIKIGEKMLIDDFDINVILSNLLLNACEAIQKCERKEINIFMRYDRGTTKISIRNTYNGTVIESKKGLLSTKKDKRIHGIGLESVRKTVAKYDGEINTNYTENEFTVNILLYL